MIQIQQEIPEKILSEAKKEYFLRGRIKKKTYIPIKKEQMIVGFYNPHFDKLGNLRLGPIYVLPKFRGNGLAKKIITTDALKYKSKVYVESENDAAMNLFSKIGFTFWKKYGNGNIFLNSYAAPRDIACGSDMSKVDVVYSDPPWGPGNLRYWRTMNGEQVAPEWKDFTKGLVKECKQAQHVFMEMGVRWQKEVVEIIGEHIPHVQSWEVFYKSGAKTYPVSLNYFSKKNSLLLPDLTSMTGEQYTWLCISAAAKAGNKTIKDMCCGKGMTAKFAVANNMIFKGSDINEKRLQKTREWIEKVANKREQFYEKWEQKYGLS